MDALFCMGVGMGGWGLRNGYGHILLVCMGVGMGFEKRLWTRVAIFGCDSFVCLDAIRTFVLGSTVHVSLNHGASTDVFLTTYRNASFSGSTLMHQRRPHSYASAPAAALLPCWLWALRSQSPLFHLALLTWTPRIQIFAIAAAAG